MSNLNNEMEIPLLSSHLDKINIYEKGKGKWFIKSHDIDGKEKLIIDETKNQKKIKEIIKQLFLFELTDNYGYPIDKIKTDEKVSLGREKRKADIVVYQEDGVTPLIIVIVKSPNERLNIPEIKSYLNAEGSPIVAATNGKVMTVLYRPYSKEFDDNLPDIPTYAEYLKVKDTENPTIEVVDIILNRRWTLEELEKKTRERQKSLRGTFELLEELVLANSGVDTFNEILKLIYVKLFDEWKALNGSNKELKFRKYKDPMITYRVISELFENAKQEWKGVFEMSEKIKLAPRHLNMCVTEMQEMKLLGTDLRIVDEAFEYLIPNSLRSKDGIYSIPKVLTDAIVKMLNPHDWEHIISIAYDNTHFLMSIIQHIQNKYYENEEVKHTYAERYLWVVNSNDKDIKISNMIMLFSGINKSHIYRENPLEYVMWNDRLKDDLRREGLTNDNKYKELIFDIVIAVPPFKETIEDPLVKSFYEILPEDKKKPGVKVDSYLLFIERALDMLRPSGRLAIVLPRKVFDNNRVLEFIYKRARVLAVVDLHENTFRPYTRIKTSLVILRKWSEEELDEEGNPKIKDYPIFYTVSKIPLKSNSGNYIFVKDENGNITYRTDLFDIADKFVKWGKSRLEEDGNFDFLFDIKV
jgi:type I restriction enzyme M protein